MSTSPGFQSTIKRWDPIDNMQHKTLDPIKITGPVTDRPASRTGFRSPPLRVRADGCMQCAVK
jgi:hypothetical protein